MHVVKVEPMFNESLVKVLESMLDKAKSGKMRNLYFAGMEDKGEVYIGCVSCSAAERYTLIGYLMADANRHMGEICYEEY